MAKVVLAYAGDLDTSICVHWLKSAKNLKVVTFSAHLGQPQSLESLGRGAIEIGAGAAHIGDLRERFLEEFAFPTLWAGARYEGGYLLSSAIARALIAQELVRVAEEEGCEFVAHGCRGIGNDLVRFERCIRALAPDLKILAPFQEAGLTEPNADRDYAQRHGIKVQAPRRGQFHVDQNLWGVSLQANPFGDLWVETPPETHVLTVPLSETPDEPAYLEVEFKEGRPVALDGEAIGPVKLLETLNGLGGRHGIGRLDTIENRISGVKSRELYEAPGAEVLHKAYAALESIVLDKVTLHFIEPNCRDYGRLVYDGHWFHPLREALDGFFAKFRQRVTGTVRMKLYRGCATVAGRKSPNSLFRAEEVHPSGAERTRTRHSRL